MTGILRAKGNRINHKRIHRLFKLKHCQCTAFWKKARKYNSYHGNHHVYPNLLDRDFKTALFGRKLTTDVSEFRWGNEDIHHRVYLSPILDLKNDEVVASNISDHPTLAFTMKPLIQAMIRFKHLPYRAIVHSDQGIQYQSLRWTKTLHLFSAVQSMSRKGTCLDNTQIKSFFHIMKDEMMNRHYDTKAPLIRAMKDWI